MFSAFHYFCIPFLGNLTMKLFIMRSFNLYLWLLPILTTALSCSDKGNIIEGTVNGIGSEKVYLHAFEGKNLRLIDSTESRKNVFTFEMPPERKHGMYHIRWGKQGNEGIDIIYNYADVRFTTIKDSLHKTEFQNSSENDLFFTFYPIRLTIEQLYSLGDRMFTENPSGNRQKLIELSLYLDSLEYSVQQMLDDLDSTSRNLFAYKVIRSAFPPNFEYEYDKNNTINVDESVFMRDHFFLYTDFKEPGLSRTPFLHHSVEKYLQQYVFPKDEAQFRKACDFIISRAAFDDEMYDYIVNLLIRTFENSDYWEVYLYLMETYQTEICEDETVYQDKHNLYEIVKKSRPGNQAPDIKGFTPDGKLFSFHETGKGNANVLLFWDPDCEHCKMIIDQLVLLWPVYKKKGLNVVTYGLTTSKKEWAEAIVDHQMGMFFNITDLKDTESEVFDKYHIRGTPEIYVITKDYTIFSRPSNYIQLDNDLMQILK
jgi:hypothetical protein